MSGLVSNVGKKLGVQKPTEEYKNKPVKMTAKEAASLLKGKKKILILTGAGVSAASGIPTFRGQDGFWKRSYGGVDNPETILTKKYFAENPAAVWEWHYDFFEIQAKGKPN